MGMFSRLARLTRLFDLPPIITTSHYLPQFQTIINEGIFAKNPIAEEVKKLYPKTQRYGVLFGESNIYIPSIIVNQLIYESMDDVA